MVGNTVPRLNPLAIEEREKSTTTSIYFREAKSIMRQTFRPHPRNPDGPSPPPGAAATN